MNSKEYQKELREYCKERHICYQCKQKDAYTMNGHLLCADCTEKQNARCRKWMENPENKKKQNARVKEIKDKRRAEHKCIRCGKQIDENDNHKYCGICRFKERQRYYRKSERPARVYGVVCWMCNKKPVADGRKVCEECYEKLVKTCKENLFNEDGTHKYQMKEDHPWKRGFVYGKNAY